MTRHTAKHSERAAVIYCRISKDDAGTALGVKRQEKLCRQLAADRGLDVAHVYVDNDLSASNGKRRPAFEQLLDDAEAGTIGAVICYHVDRLYRRSVELERIVPIVERTQLGIYAATAGDIDLSSASGRMVARMLGASAQHEVERMSERIRAKLADLAANGAPCGGPRPFGYSDDFTINESEAAWVRYAAQRVLDGHSTLTIARELNEAGVRTHNGNIWRYQVLHRLLTSGTIAGLRVHRGEIAGPGSWEPILDRVTWEEVVAVLSHPARRRTRASSFVLSGLVRTTSGQTLVGGTRRGKREYQTNTPTGHYETTAAERPRVDWMRANADELESLVIEAALTRTDRGKLGPATSVSSAAVETLAALEAERDELARLAGEGEIGMSEWLAARKPLEARLAAARAAAPQRAAGRSLVDSTLRKRWESKTLDHAQQRAALRELIECVVVERTPSTPSRRPDPRPLAERVTITWRA